MPILPPIYPHKRVFLGFEIAKTLELPGAEPPDPCKGMGSPVDSAWYENFIVKLHQIKANQTSIQH